jgi:menaquinol-cytochrome c reductase iron-sulfur subunit
MMHESSAGGCGCGSRRTDRGVARRGFLAQAVALVCGLIALAVPAAVGVVAFLNPLRQKGGGGGLFRVASLAVLPEDGTPRKFSIIADRVDAWNRVPNEPIGAIFLRRTKDGVDAFQVICPHAGCAIAYEASAEGGQFLCPCHAARFGLDGRRLDATSMSPRDMDRLEVETRDNSEIWVKFQNFRTGTPQKVTLA